jgi:predicted  nucleic acid-binding Zn-ribbon protein
VPATGKVRSFREADPLDGSALPEADKTKENRGAVGIKYDKGGLHNTSSITTNAASGTIGGDTPPPIFDRAAIAAGQKAGPVTERAGHRPSPTGRVPLAGTPAGAGPTSTKFDGSLATSDTAHLLAARGTPKPGALAGKVAQPTPPLSPVIVDDSLHEPLAKAPPAIAPPPAASRLAVPIGEFDHGQTILGQNQRRAAASQATIQRDAASAVLGLAEPAFAAPTPAMVEELPIDSAAQLREDATFNDTSGPSPGRIERDDPTVGDPTVGDDRGDPTISAGSAGRDDATTVSAGSSSHGPTGTLRSAATLPRQRGIAGDIRYIATVVFGVRKANRELAALEARQATRQQSRRHHLITLGRTAVTYPDPIDSDPAHRTGPHPALGPARAQLAKVEGERAQHADHVAAADSELTRLRSDREAKAKQYLADLAALDHELAALARKLEPLDKEVSGIKKRAADLRDSLRRIDAKIAATEASLSSARAEKLDRAEVQAELATLKADRKAIQRDEPVIAGELDALTPRIAALEAARGEAQRKRAELETAEQNDQRRIEEMLTAIGAKRKVVDRAAGDAEALRDKILFQLGERLCVDRPDHLIGQLAPIDEIDVELGEADRQMMELREILSSIDKGKIARGIALIVLVLGALGAATGGLLYLFL